MSNVDPLKLLQAREHLEELKTLAAEVADHPDAARPLQLLRVIEQGIDIVELMTDTLNHPVMPLPWWRDWQERHSPSASDV